MEYLKKAQLLIAVPVQIKASTRPDSIPHFVFCLRIRDGRDGF